MGCKSSKIPQLFNESFEVKVPVSDAHATVSSPDFFLQAVRELGQNKEKVEIENREEGNCFDLVNKTKNSRTSIFNIKTEGTTFVYDRNDFIKGNILAMTTHVTFTCTENPAGGTTINWKVEDF